VTKKKSVYYLPIFTRTGWVRTRHDKNILVHFFLNHSVCHHYHSSSTESSGHKPVECSSMNCSYEILSQLYIIPTKLDRSRREAIDGYASACAHSALLRMLPAEWRLSREGFCSVVCVASGIDIKKKVLWERLPEGEGLSRGGGWRRSCLGAPSPYAYRI